MTKSKGAQTPPAPSRTEGEAIFLSDCYVVPSKVEGLLAMTFLSSSKCFLFDLSASILAKIARSRLLTLPSKSKPLTTDCASNALDLRYFTVPVVPQNWTDLGSSSPKSESRIDLSETAAKILRTFISSISV